MILNNTTNATANWSVSNSEGKIEGTKSYESWGTITPPAGPFNYTAEFSGPQGTAKAENIDNPDACLTYTGNEILVTYPGA